MQPDRFASRDLGFFEQVRSLERRLWAARRGAANSDAVGESAAVGEWGDYADEAIHFRAANSVAHPGGAVEDVQHRSEDVPQPAWLVDVNFMGLVGPMGVLPTYFTTLLLGEGEAARPALRDFLALFEHRFISRFYRAWELSRVLFGLERSARHQRDDSANGFTLVARSLTGLADRAFCRRLKLSERLPVFYSGVLSNLVRPAENLPRIVTAALGVPAKLLEFRAEWQTIAVPQRTRLAAPERSALGARRWNNKLGSTACVGSRVWTVQDRFELQLGPLDYETFNRFTPAGDLFAVLMDLVRLYAGTELAFDIRPILEAEAVPRSKLRSQPLSATRLGWNSWLISRPAEHPADDAVFAGSA